MDDPVRTPELFHPELRKFTRAYTYPRMSWMTKWWYPAEEHIGWFGNLIRESGANGMYATVQQAQAWPAKLDEGDIKIGPSK